MATAILLGVTGVSRAQALVVDVQNGYFDRLLLTPVRRSAILLGHMVADVAVSATLCVPIIALAFALGVDFEAGALGVLVFIVIASLWSLAFAGFGYAIALKTGNPAAVNSSFLLFFPFLFLTSSYVPRDQLSGWLDTVAGWNPVTYLLEGMRSLALERLALGRPRPGGAGPAGGVPRQLLALLRRPPVPGEPALNRARTGARFSVAVPQDGLPTGRSSTDRQSRRQGATGIWRTDPWAGTS